MVRKLVNNCPLLLSGQMSGELLSREQRYGDILSDEELSSDQMSGDILSGENSSEAIVR